MENTGEIIDAHCHLIDYEEDELLSVIKHSKESGISGIIENATKEDNWSRVSAIADLYPGYVFPSYGIHPYYLNSITDEWEIRLEEIISNNPSALVGEIGLDFCKKEYEKSFQIEIFKKQLDLAIKYKRPCTVHSVRAHGETLKIFKKLFKAKSADGYSQVIIMHSFGASKEIAESLLKLTSAEVYFSFCQISSERTEEVLRTIPLDRLLLETDSPHQISLETIEKFGDPSYKLKDNKNPNLDVAKLNEPAYCMYTLKKASGILEVSVSELSKQILSNSRRILMNILK